MTKLRLFRFGFVDRSALFDSSLGHRATYIAQVISRLLIRRDNVSTRRRFNKPRVNEPQTSSFRGNLPYWQSTFSFVRQRKARRCARLIFRSSSFVRRDLATIDQISPRFLPSDFYLQKAQNTPACARAKAAPARSRTPLMGTRIDQRSPPESRITPVSSVAAPM